VYKSNL